MPSKHRILNNQSYVNWALNRQYLGIDIADLRGGFEETEAENYEKILRHIETLVDITYEPDRLRSHLSPDTQECPHAGMSPLDLEAQLRLCVLRLPATGVVGEMEQRLEHRTLG